MVRLLVAVGVALRTLQFLASSSMWLDELALAHTVVVRPLIRLVTEPLAYFQVAPAGFLVLERLAITSLGTSDHAFRLIPYLASLVGLFMFWRLSVHLLPRLGATVAVGLFALSPALVVYAAQAKQYSSDVAAVTALLWAAVELSRGRSRAAAVPVAAGAAALLLSLSAVLAGAAIGGVLMWYSLRTGQPSRRTLITIAMAWGVAAGTTVLLSRMTVSPETAEYMQRFWARGFPPAPWIDPIWIPVALAKALGFSAFWYAPEGSWVAQWAAGTLIMTATLGVWWFWRHDRQMAGIVFAPIIAAVAAAAFHVLPLDSRAALWLCPPLLLVAGAGFRQLGQLMPPVVRDFPTALGATVVVFACIVLVLDPPPYRSQNLRPVLDRVVASAQPEDAVYVYYGARLGVRFYGPRAGLRTWAEGACHRGDTRAYFRELDRFRGRPRFWVIWTHANPYYGEPEAIRSYLSSIGRELQRIDAPHGETGQEAAQAVLYDLSDTHRLAATTAERHEIPPPEDPGAGFAVACGGPANDSSVVR